MLLKPKAVAEAIVSEVPDLPPLVAELRTTVFSLNRALIDADSPLVAAIRTADMVVGETRPLISDAQEAVSAWKTAGQAVTITCGVICLATLAALIIVANIKR